jgi:hypothetical protein
MQAQPGRSAFPTTLRRSPCSQVTTVRAMGVSRPRLFRGHWLCPYRKSTLFIAWSAAFCRAAAFRATSARRVRTVARSVHAPHRKTPAAAGACPHSMQIPADFSRSRRRRAAILIESRQCAQWCFVTSGPRPQRAHLPSATRWFALSRRRCCSLVFMLFLPRLRRARDLGAPCTVAGNGALSASSTSQESRIGGGLSAFDAQPC